MENRYIAIVSDTHLGARGNSRLFLEYMYWYWTEEFIPYCKERGITTVIHGGDYWDNRSSLNLLALDYHRKIEAAFRDAGITMLIVVGNHDLHFRDVSDINSVDLTCGVDSPFKSVREYTEMEFGSAKIALCPWINKENHEEIMERYSTTDADVLVSHLEVEGFRMYKTSSLSEGLSRDIFKRFKRVFSGHYHHPSRIGNIEYVGSVFPMSWADFGDVRGFNVLDTETLETEYVENEYSLFHELHYQGYDEENEIVMANDRGESIASMDQCFVRLVVEEVDDEAEFDACLTALKKVATDVTVIDKRELLATDFKEAAVEDLTKDTLELAEEFYDELGLDEKMTERMKEFFVELHEKALPILLAGE